MRGKLPCFRNDQGCDQITLKVVYEAIRVRSLVEPSLDVVLVVILILEKAVSDFFGPIIY